MPSEDETKAKIRAHYDDIVQSALNHDPRATFDVVARALAGNLATALTCIEMQHERMNALECEVLRLMAFVSGEPMPEGDGDV